MSLDGVLNGDISPDLATATSFQHLGGRPVYHADALKSLGYRAVPMVRNVFPGSFVLSP